MFKKAEIDIATIELLSGNIFNVTAASGAEVDLAGAKRLISTTNGMLDADVKYRAGIYDISNIAHVDADARAYLITTDDVKGKVACSAIISNTLIGKTVGSLFLAFEGQKKFPIKMFDSPIRAEHWVRTRLKELIAKDSMA